MVRRPILRAISRPAAISSYIMERLMSLSLARRVIEYASRADRRRTVFAKCFSRQLSRAISVHSLIYARGKCLFS
jgi:hypothetical protein